MHNGLNAEQLVIYIRQLRRRVRQLEGIKSPATWKRRVELKRACGRLHHLRRYAWNAR